MITRAHIRRQLRKNGGIMNVTPRQGYFLGGIGDAIGDVLGKAGKVTFLGEHVMGVSNGCLWRACVRVSVALVFGLRPCLITTARRTSR